LRIIFRIHRSQIQMCFQRAFSWTKWSWDHHAICVCVWVRYVFVLSLLSVLNFQFWTSGPFWNNPLWTLFIHIYIYLLFYLNILYVSVFYSVCISCKCISWKIYIERIKFFRILLSFISSIRAGRSLVLRQTYQKLFYKLRWLEMWIQWITFLLSTFCSVLNMQRLFFFLSEITIFPKSK
jgi:hypothetical protein